MQASKPTPLLPFLVSFWLLLFLFVQQSVALIAMSAGIPVSSFFISASLLLTTLVFFIIERKNISWKTSALISVVSILLVLFMPLLAGILLDTTWDGQWYHQAAIAKMANGWNPIQEPNYALTKYDETNYLWIQHYPKFSWITGAGFYKLFHSIEHAKTTNFILVVISFLQAYYVTKKIPKKSKILPGIIALIIALHPVVTAQIFSDYIDGLMASSITILALQFITILFIADATFKKERVIIIFIAICISCNLKFSGILLSGLMSAVFMLMFLLQKPTWKSTISWATIFTSAYLIAIFAWGFNPYVTNFISKGHPLFPLNQTKQYDYIMHSEPAMMHGKLNAEKLFISVFSETGNDIKDDKIDWRIPGVISKNELRIWAGADVRISGFGPLFSLAFILSLLAIVSCWFYSTMPNRTRLMITLFGTGILLTVIIFPQSWWARYAPQLFLFPAITALLLLLFSNTGKSSLATLLSYGIIAVLFINMSFISGINWGANVVKTNMIKKEMDALRKEKKPILISFYKTDFQTSRIRLKEANVMFTEMDSLPVGQVKELRTIYSLDGFGPKYMIQP